MPKVKIRATNPNGYWIVDEQKHKEMLDEHKKKSGWVEPTEVAKLTQQGITVPPHMLSEPILPQKPGKFIPATETEMELSDEELKQLRDNSNVMLLEGGGDDENKRRQAAQEQARRGHKSE